MTTRKILLLLTLAVCAAACADTAPPPPVVVPQGDDRFLVDPRLGHDAIPPELDRRFEAAWRFVLAGDEEEARRRLTQILTRDPGFVPALLAEAALEIRAGRFDAARAIVERVQRQAPDSLAARLYEAEIAFRDGQTRAAFELYRDLAGRPGAPEIVRERLAALESAMFNELLSAAQTAPEEESIRLLREALAINPGAIEPRILLARRLLAQRRFEEVREELEPILPVTAERAEVQELLGEAEVGLGKYPEAIVRFDRLARRTRDPRHEQRLEEVKREWSAANMPQHFREAMQSDALTRAELATLLYWIVPSVRFAQNLGTPPIAIDVADVAGREEIIRAIAIGLFQVDPITRRVSPYRQVTASRLSTLLARTLMLRGAPCAQNVPQDEVLTACSVPDPLATYPANATVTGGDAAVALEQVAKALQ